MWFDSVVHSPAVARDLIDVVGADRLVIGTDYLSPQDGREHIAVVRDGRLYGCRTPERLLDLLGDEGEALRAAGRDALADPLERLPLPEATLLAPIPVPPSIRDFMAFEDHLRPILEARGATVDPAWYEIPAFCFPNPAATLGPADDVPAAPGAAQLDFELEVASPTCPPATAPRSTRG